ncbi:hypothetical protein ACFV1N_39300 [Streptosporangium canum]|uniref:hypothetical protein n=1 Tax=Streptosporangium canum TaxID=324952 RepID=UPI0036AAB640
MVAEIITSPLLGRRLPAGPQITPAGGENEDAPAFGSASTGRIEEGSRRTRRSRSAGSPGDVHSHPATPASTTASKMIIDLAPRDHPATGREESGYAVPAPLGQIGRRSTSRDIRSSAA